MKALLCAVLTLILTVPIQAQGKPASLTITVQPGARQTFAGLGASLFRFTPSADYNRQLTRAQQRALPRRTRGTSRPTSTAG